jgi:hypothetical protein
MTPITVKAGPFSAEIGAATLRADELRSFRVGLEQVYRFEPVEAVLQSMEHWLAVRVRMLSRGRLAIEGDAWGFGQAGWEAARGNWLHFEFDGLDQSFLPAVISDLQAIEAAYPILGTPTGPA